MHPLEVLANRLLSNRRLAAFGLLQIGVTQPENYLCGGNLFVRRPRTARFTTIPSHFATLIEVILDPGSSGVICHELEFNPQPVQFLLPLLVKYKLN